jgi:LPXTG-motif cell wall-anchored protein
VTENETSGWTADFDSAYIKGLVASKNIVIKYDAVLTEESFSNVNEETNEVTVEFSNNPNNTSEKGKIKDKTRAYTFTIDGTLLGQGNIKTSELIKVAVDGNGDPIIQESSTNTTYKNALAGATFGLYTDSGCTTPYVNKTGDNGSDHEWTDIITDSDGYMEINGLEEGTYYLKELTAPTGFVKDQTVHEIVISATYDTETITEDGYTYTVPKLATYTITIDGADTSTYNMTLDGSDIAISSIDPSSSLLNNTKGVELPSTGGIGTTIFYVIGAILVLGAGILLVTRRRMDLG